MSRLNVGSFRHPDGTADNISLTSTGRVGIGIASPSQLLEINGASTPGVQIKDTTNNVIARIGANDNTGLIGTRSNHPTVFQINDAEVARLDTSGNLRFNSGYGSVATAYGVRAWCNADLTGSGSIRASGNMSSLGDQGTGRWQFIFASSMPDANYAAIGMQKPNADVVNITGIHPTASFTTYSSAQVAFVYSNASGGLIDPLIGNIAIIR